MLEQVVSQVHAEVFSRNPLACGEDGVAQAELLMLIDQRHLGVRHLLEGLCNFGSRGVRHHDGHLIDAGCQEGAEGMNDNRGASHGQHRFGPRVGEGTQAGAEPGSRDDSFHDMHSRKIQRLMKLRAPLRKWSEGPRLLSARREKTAL